MDEEKSHEIYGEEAKTKVKRPVTSLDSGSTRADERNVTPAGPHGNRGPVRRIYLGFP